MGHFMPIMNCATALKDAGHDVYIITNGNDFIKEKTKGYEEKYGFTMVYTNCGLTNEDAMKDPPNKCDGDPINIFLETWRPYVKESMKLVAPDIVVSDFFSVPGVYAAQELDIPVVINVPGPVAMFVDYAMFTLPDMGKASNCCGLICMRKTFGACFLQFILSKVQKLQYPIFTKGEFKHVWMFNSFFGVEPTRCIPPNIKMVGQINQDPADLMRILQDKDIKLYQWLEEAKSQNIDVIYMSMGSLV